jgi:ferritin
MLMMETLLTDIECKELNKFGRLELIASHAYLQLANRMQSLSYFGAEQFFMNESNGERDHYRKIGKFMNDLNCEISVEPVEAGPCECKDIKDALMLAYEMERDLLTAYETAAKRTDLSLKVVLLLQDFTSHQVEAVGEYNDLIARLALTDDMLLFDKDLAQK